MATNPEEYERDPGLASERTELAWGRSTLALFACGAAIAKGIPKVTGEPGRPIAGLALCLVGALAWISGLPYARARARGRRAPSLRSRRRALAFLALGSMAVGVGALVIATVLPA